LRVVPEIWRVQDRLAETYTEVAEENLPQPDGRILQIYVFSNPSNRRLIKVSQENFVVVFNSYGSFEEFKNEALTRVQEFSDLFEVKTYSRAGLRYVNHIELPAKDGVRLLQKYVNVPVDFDRFDPKTIEQLLTEFRLTAGNHKITVRGALIQLPTKVQQLLYILDLDCFGLGHFESASLPSLLDEFHHHIQLRFLEHITDEYKSIMRRRP
jgi:uncharacterized protein (TIGR04255 family)